ncbi:hypothetical protein EDE11_12343 [Methylomonas methanica]|uniref:Uncharacterized protein n=1 Tax=Methylomonas methanica TaxID=421 RepID=A0ABY2CLE8_METMH|nr:hypothetical protein EDE11_12343 [Methylomonas methanica]
MKPIAAKFISMLFAAIKILFYAISHKNLKLINFAFNHG